MSGHAPEPTVWDELKAAWRSDTPIALMTPRSSRLAALLMRMEEEQSAAPNPRISWDEPPDDETLDDFLARDVEWVHFEALDDCQWYANIKLADGQLWTLNFGSVSGRAKGYANAEQVE